MTATSITEATVPTIDTNQRKQQLLIEQNNWFARPIDERQPYAG